MQKLNRLFEQILRETTNVNGKNLIIVDVQPEYKDGFDWWLDDFIDFLNENKNNFNSITFFYNGAETLGMIEEYDYKEWWYENELDEDVVHNSIFYDKGYAFFRYCMDKGIDDDDISNLVKYMMSHNINDSRELDKEFWIGFMNEYGVSGEEIRELLEFSDDCLSIPDLMSELQHHSNIVICGGGEHECLKEVNIALDALNKPYQTLSKYIY